MSNDSAADLTRMAHLVEEWQALRRSQAQDRVQRFGRVVTEFSALPRTRPSAFNVFSLFNMRDDELQHSRFLAWLLDARSAHGQGNQFLCAFARASRMELPEELLTGYRVLTEMSGAESVGGHRRMPCT